LLRRRPGRCYRCRSEDLQRRRCPNQHPRWSRCFIRCSTSRLQRRTSPIQRCPSSIQRCPSSFQCCPSRFFGRSSCKQRCPRLPRCLKRRFPCLLYCGLCHRQRHHPSQALCHPISVHWWSSPGYQGRCSRWRCCPCYPRFVNTHQLMVSSHSSWWSGMVSPLGLRT